MIELKKRREIPAPADKVWKILENFGDLSWVELDNIVEASGEGVGMKRTVIFSQEAPPIVEILTGIDSTNKMLSYDIPQCESFPFENYQAKVEVQASTENACTVHWSCKFGAGQLPTEAATEMMEGNYKILLDSLYNTATA